MPGVPIQQPTPPSQFPRPLREELSRHQPAQLPRALGATRQLGMVWDVSKLGVLSSTKYPGGFPEHVPGNVTFV